MPGVRNRVAVVVVAAVLSLHPASAAPLRPSADLERALTAYHRATVGNDTTMLAALVTDDYRLVNSDGSIQDKASYLADFAVPGFKLDPYEVENPIYSVRGQAALTAWSFRLSWTQDSRHHTRRLRIAHFWVHERGRWQIAYTQLTRIPD